MLKETFIQSRTRELFESSGGMHYEEYQINSDLAYSALDAIEELIPLEHIDKFKKLVDDYESANCKIINVFERDAYKQGLIDGFEIYSLVFPVKE